MRKHLIYVQFYNMSQLNLCFQEILCTLMFVLKMKIQHVKNQFKQVSFDSSCTFFSVV